MYCKKKIIRDNFPLYSFRHPKSMMLQKNTELSKEGMISRMTNGKTLYCWSFKTKYHHCLDEKLPSLICNFSSPCTAVHQNVKRKLFPWSKKIPKTPVTKKSLCMNWKHRLRRWNLPTSPFLFMGEITLLKTMSLLVALRLWKRDPRKHSEQAGFVLRDKQLLVVAVMANLTTGCHLKWRDHC